MAAHERRPLVLMVCSLIRVNYHVMTIIPLIFIIKGSYLVANPLLRLTFTLVAGLTLTVAGGTFTLIRSYSVDAVPSGTKTWYRLALIHI